MTFITFEMCSAKPSSEFSSKVFLNQFLTWRLRICKDQWEFFSQVISTTDSFSKSYWIWFFHVLLSDISAIKQNRAYTFWEWKLLLRTISLAEGGIWYLLFKELHRTWGSGWEFGVSHAAWSSPGWELMNTTVLSDSMQSHQKWVERK